MNEFCYFFVGNFVDIFLNLIEHFIGEWTRNEAIPLEIWLCLLRSASLLLSLYSSCKWYSESEQNTDMFQLFLNESAKLNRSV